MYVCEYVYDPFGVRAGVAFSKLLTFWHYKASLSLSLYNFNKLFFRTLLLLLLFLLSKIATPTKFMQFCGTVSLRLPHIFFIFIFVLLTNFVYEHTIRTTATEVDAHNLVHNENNNKIKKKTHLIFMYVKHAV